MTPQPPDFGFADTVATAQTRVTEAWWIGLGIVAVVLFAISRKK